MDDALRMCGCQPLGEGRRNLDGLDPGKPRLCEPLPQRLPLEQLSDGVGDALIGTKVVDGEDVRMRQGGHRLRFALEPFERVAVVRQMLGEHLDGDVAVESRVVSPVDFAHSTGADECDDLVGPEHRAESERHIGSAVPIVP